MTTFNKLLEAIGTNAWDSERNAKRQHLSNNQDRQTAITMLNQVIGSLNQGDIYGTASQVRDLGSRVSQLLSGPEAGRLPVHPAEILNTVADQLDGLENQFSNLTTKNHVKNITKDQTAALQNVAQWLNQLSLWKI